MSMFENVIETGKHRIYTFRPDTKYNTWDEIIANGDTLTVEEFDTLDKALQAYEEKYNDPDIYGAE